MLLSGEQSAGVMAAKYPYVTAGLTRLCGLRADIIGSRAAEHAGLALGIVLPPGDDWDLQVHPDDFYEAATRLRAEVEKDKLIQIPTGDNKLLTLAADEARADLNGYTVQFMLLHSPIYLGRRPFLTAYTDRAATARHLYETDNGVLSFAHDVETLTLYGLHQGVGAKHDAARAAALRATRDPATNFYAAARAREIHWDERLHRFAQDAAQGAALRRSQALAA